MLHLQLNNADFSEDALQETICLKSATAWPDALSENADESGTLNAAN